MKRIAAGVLVTAALITLSGCAAADPKVLADEKCGDISENPNSYSDSADGDWANPGEYATDLASVEVTEGAREVPEGGAYNVTGTAKLSTSSDATYNITWRCFSQTNDGTTYANIVEWNR
jgi:hypothetical protein